MERHSATSVPFLVLLLHSLCLRVGDVDPERRGVSAEQPRRSNAYVKGAGGAARGTRIPLQPAALNVSVFSLPQLLGGGGLFALSLHIGISS